jgi:hypothetical protein
MSGFFDSEQVRESLFELDELQHKLFSELMEIPFSDKDKKFRDGDGCSVSLSFSRIMTHLDSNIKKGDSTKDWTTIKQKLIDANSLDEVQDVIDKYKMSFASNYIAGTRRRKRHGKKRTHRRR